MKYYATIDPRFREYSPPSSAVFGITAALAAPLIAGLTDVGVGAGVAGAVGTGIAGGALGAAGTAAFDAITGQPITPLGVLSGALPGAAIGGLGPAIGSATGLGTTAGDVLAGAGAGAAGAGLTGSNPLLGAATGGAEGLAAGVTGGGAGAGATPTTSPVAAGVGPSAASFGVSAPATTAAPATSAAPLASATGGGAPATTQIASASGGGVSNIPTGGGQGVGSNWPSFADTATAGGTQWPSPSATTPIPSAGGDDFLSKITGFAKSNPGLLLSAAPLALSMFGSPSQVPGQAQLQNQQLQAQSMGKTLSAFQLSGTLPPGMQQVVDAKTAADKAAVRSHFAQLGYTGSTAEVQALEQIDQASTGQIALLGQQLASQGLDWTHISQQELETLLNAQLKQQSDFSSALSSLAKGLVPIGSAIDKAAA